MSVDFLVTQITAYVTLSMSYISACSLVYELGRVQPDLIIVFAIDNQREMQ